MSNDPNLLSLLRNVSVRDFEQALVRDGFLLKRQTRTGGRFYENDDGRMTIIHFHHGSDRLTRKTLSSVLEATRWTVEDARRLGLIS